MTLTHQGFLFVEKNLPGDFLPRSGYPLYIFSGGHSILAFLPSFEEGWGKAQLNICLINSNKCLILHSQIKNGSFR